MLYNIIEKRDGVVQPPRTVNYTALTQILEDPTLEMLRVEHIDLTKEYGRTAYLAYMSPSDPEFTPWEELNAAKKNRWISAGLAAGDLRTQEMT